MKQVVKDCLLVAVMLLPIQLFSQKDTVKLICPLNDAMVVPPPKNVIHYDQDELCVVLRSVPDTMVKAAATGKITNTEYNEDTRNGVVLFVKIGGKEYYLWYTGMSKLLVKRNDVVKAGQPVGIVPSGEKIELIMYEFETPVDPVKFLDCKGVLKNSE